MSCSFYPRSFVALQLIGVTLAGGDAGSTVDAMSDAIEGADVMLYGVSLAYKESANVSALSALSILAACPCVARHASALMVTLSCALQCRMVRVGRAAQLGHARLPNMRADTYTFRPRAHATQEANYGHQQELDIQT